MTQALRIIAADDDPDIRGYYSKMLEKLGHQVVGIAATGAELVRQCRERDPDLLITDIKMPDMEGIEAALKIYEEKPYPIILVSGVFDPKAFERAMQEQVVAYLLKPVTAAQLREQISLVMRRFAEFQTLCGQTTQFRQALRDRKIVERAKAILVKNSGFDEAAAFDRVAELAQQSNDKIVNAAQRLVSAAQVAS